jgi:hypothetical protein
VTTTVALSLVSHTNVGKTTLARTLLRRDVGEVADRAHVTDVSEAHVLAEVPGARMLLWDTPGFGDSARLLRRLRREGDALGWFLREVWDRFADRPLWCAQQAVRNVREDADVVLYLVNAGEDPERAGYPRAELEILSWIGRPVLLLLNQTGEGDDAARAQAWRRLASDFPVVEGVLSLDAFTRCWVEEGRLLEHVVEVVPESKREAAAALADAWGARHREVFRACARRVAEHLVAAASDREPLGGGEGGERASWLGGVLRALAGLATRVSPEERRAMEAMGERLRRSAEDLMTALASAHGLDREGATRVERRVEDLEKSGGRRSAGKGAAWGGLLGGATTGVAADLMTGGLTLGSGMIVGAIAGMFGGAGLVKTVEAIGGKRAPSVAWKPDFLDGLFREALLRYVAVAHFGRGRGAFRDEAEPARWQAAAAAVAAPGAAAWERVRSGREAGAAVLEPHVLAAARAALLSLHPDCERWIG